MKRPTNRGVDDRVRGDRGRREEPESGPVCGDGAQEGLEQCDDGNTVNGDECTNACVLPPWYGRWADVRAGETASGFVCEYVWAAP